MSNFKVLITSVDANPYVGEVYTKISNVLEIERSVQQFYQPSNQFGVIHIQWIEELFNWQTPTEEQIAQAFKCLIEWKQSGKIIVTRHNYLPNHGNVDVYKKVYDFFFLHADVIIHLGNFSLSEFGLNMEKIKAKQVIIPHHIYQFYSNNVSKEIAKKKLGIAEQYKVVLCFGKIRTEREKQLIKKAFGALKLHNKFLLIPRWKYSSIRAGKIDKSINMVKHMLYKNFKRFYFTDEVIADDDIQLYFNASDVVLLPRENHLNSGVLFLGLAFNKIVVGTEKGNIGEVLKEFGFPTFQEANAISIAVALQQAFHLSNDNIVEQIEQNKEKYSLENAVKQHLSLYQSLLN